MRTPPVTPSPLGVYPRKRDWECNPRNAFPETVSGIYPWELIWESYGRKSTGTVSRHYAPASRPREQPLLPPSGAGGGPGHGEAGSRAPRTPELPPPRRRLGATRVPLRPCPHGAGPAPLHWGQDRGHT